MIRSDHGELAASARICGEAMLLAPTKIDAAQDPARVEALKALAAERGLPLLRDL